MVGLQFFSSAVLLSFSDRNVQRIGNFSLGKLMNRAAPFQTESRKMLAHFQLHDQIRCCSAYITSARPCVLVFLRDSPHQNVESFSEE